MIVSSIFELSVLSLTSLKELLGKGVGEVYSVNIAAHRLPEEGKQVLWISRTCDIEVGSYLTKYNRVDLLSGLGFGEDSLLRTTSFFHFWIDVEHPEVFSHKFSRIKTGGINHGDPVVAQVQEAFFDLFGRVMQYLGPYNQPPENRKIMLVDTECAYHLGYYHKHEDNPATISLCDSDLVYPADHFIMWNDLQLAELEHLLKLGTNGKS